MSFTFLQRLLVVGPSILLGMLYALLEFSKSGLLSWDNPALAVNVMLTPFIIPLFVNSIAANSFLSLIQKVIVLALIVAHPITLKWWAVIPTICGVMIWFEIGLAAAYAVI